MRSIKRWGACAVLLLVGLAGPACDRPSSRTVGRLTVNGRAEVVTVDGGVRDVTGARTLKSGEQVRMLDGTAVLSLGPGRQLELRKGTSLRLSLSTGRTRRTEPRGELVSGDVLVLGSEDPATVLAGDSTVEVTGAARVSRGLAVVVAVYQGAAGVESAGRPVSVPALRQVTVPAPGLPSRPAPLTYSASDAWDQRFLGDAIDLGDQLVTRSRGFTAQLGTDARTTESLMRQILPALGNQPGFNASLLDERRAPGETLIGASIALEGSKATFPERWADVFAFHDDGAPWGLVALDQGVSPAPLLATVDAAIGRLPGLAAPAPLSTPGAAGTGTPVPVPSGGASSAGAAPGSGSAAGAPSAGGGDGGASESATPSGSGSGRTVPTEPLERTTGPLNLGIPLVDDTVNAVVDALSGVLRAIGRDSPPA